MNAALVRNADRMMLYATALEGGIELTFADGCKGLVPFAAIPEIKERSSISSVELPNPYEMVLSIRGGERVELPWDFVRHYCDQSYRPAVEAIARQGRQTLGERVRQFRESAGFTQEGLARAAHIGRVTLVRLEHGEQTPRYKTLTALSTALGLRVQDLLVGPELL